MHKFHTRMMVITRHFCSSWSVPPSLLHKQDQNYAAHWLDEGHVSNATGCCSSSIIDCTPMSGHQSFQNIKCETGGGYCTHSDEPLQACLAGENALSCRSGRSEGN